MLIYYYNHFFYLRNHLQLGWVHESIWIGHMGRASWEHGMLLLGHVGRCMGGPKWTRGLRARGHVGCVNGLPTRASPVCMLRIRHVPDLLRSRPLLVINWMLTYCKDMRVMCMCTWASVHACAHAGRVELFVCRCAQACTYKWPALEECLLGREALRLLGLGQNLDFSLILQAY